MEKLVRRLIDKLVYIKAKKMIMSQKKDMIKIIKITNRQEESVKRTMLDRWLQSFCSVLTSHLIYELNRDIDDIEYKLDIQSNYTIEFIIQKHHTLTIVIDDNIMKSNR